jgi:hypothetical protein
VLPLWPDLLLVDELLNDQFVILIVKVELGHLLQLLLKDCAILDHRELQDLVEF